MNPNLKGEALQEFHDFWERKAKKVEGLVDGSGYRWILEDRVRYNKVHREKDLALLHEKWKIHVNEEIAAVAATTMPTLSTRHYTNIDIKTRKKYEKVVRANRAAWEHEIDAMLPHFDHPDGQEAGRLGMEACTVLLNKIDKVLPKYQGCTIVDVTAKCRMGQAEWEKEEHGGRISIHILFWTLYRICTCKMQLNDYAGTIHFANRALSLFPPLAMGSIPSPYEVVCLFYKAKIHEYMHNNEAALDQFRACMAATRLHMHDKDPGDTGLDFLMKKCDMVIVDIVRSSVEVKIDKQTPRPYFSVEELNELEKELGIGIFNKFNYKCRGCGKPRAEVKLFPCGGCRRAWFCSKECQVEAWKKGSGSHKNMCGDKWRKVPVYAPGADSETLAAMADEGQVNMFCNSVDDSLVAYCTDEETGKPFHGLTDQPLFSDE